MKSEIVEQLGQSDLLLPLRIAEGLAANDRVKVRLSRRADILSDYRSLYH